MKKIVLLPGDGIGPEVVAQAEKLLQYVIKNNGLKAEYSSCDIGGIAYENHGHPLPQSTLAAADNADALLLGAVGGPQWETILREHRPEQALLGIRSHLGLFSNLRPAMLYPELASASSLKSELVANLDIMIVRELTGGIYFGQPRGFDTSLTGERSGFNTMVYSESEIYRIAKSAFEIAMKRDKRLCSVDKANVLECSELWREVVTTVSKQYPEVELSHMYVDNAAMQLVKAPKQFDVIVTSNLFGDILSDIAAMLTGSIGMLPSASLDINGKGMYEPVHGSAPDIAGQNKANPLATILSLSMLLRYSLDEISIADAIDNAVLRFLQSGYRSFDIATAEDYSSKVLGCNEIGDKIISLMSQS